MTVFVAVLIRTLKEHLLWLRPFQSVEEKLRNALVEWAARYNRSWLIERHGFLAPNRHGGHRDRSEGSVNAAACCPRKLDQRKRESSNDGPETFYRWKWRSGGMEWPRDGGQKGQVDV